MLTAEVIAIGTELLMGQVLNTNAQYLSRQLSALGIAQHHQTVVGDNPGRLKAAYELALSRADIIITSGGLGPTLDDLSKEVAAEVAGKTLVLRPEAEQMVRDRFKMLNRPMPDNNLRQAMFTEDTTILFNPNGTAPGGILPVGEKQFIIHLPGPPRELIPMFEASVAPFLNERSGCHLVSWYIRTFGIGESELETRLGDLVSSTNPTLSPYCSFGQVELRATASAATREEAEALLRPLCEQVKERLGDVIYYIGEGHPELETVAVEAMKQKGLTVAGCESLTGGMLMASLCGVPGASRVVRGGFVTYTNEMKNALAGVPWEILNTYGAVSAPCAMAMAKGTRERTGADIALSLTGLAGPDSDESGLPVGTVFLGLCDKDHCEAIPLQLSGDRARIRTLAALNALKHLRLWALQQ